MMQLRKRKNEKPANRYDSAPDFMGDIEMQSACSD